MFTPLTQRKVITMDYEEYLKLEQRAHALTDVIIDIINARSLDDIRPKYIEILDKINNTQQND